MDAYYRGAVDRLEPSVSASRSVAERRRLVDRGPGACTSDAASKRRKRPFLTPFPSVTSSCTVLPEPARGPHERRED